MNVSALDDKQLLTLIENHRKRGELGRPTYAEAVNEWHKRKVQGLRLSITIGYLHDAARDGKFVTYGEIAEANDTTWDRVRYPMNDHLWVLVDYARRQGWPMLSAIIVSKPNKLSGRMDGDTLAGFIRAAKALGHAVVDEDKFLSEQQEACFSWGRASILLPVELM